MTSTAPVGPASDGWRRIARLLITVDAGMAVGFLVNLVRHVSDRASLAATDFVVFRTGWWLLRHAPDRLYDPASQEAVELALMHGDGSGGFTGGFMAFLNPPHAALMTSPLGWLAETVGGPTAFRVWFAMNLGLTALLVRELRVRLRLSTLETGVLVVLLLAFEPVYEALTQGQWSILLTLAALRLPFYLREKRILAASVCLLVLSIKPQTLAPFIVLLLAYRGIRPLATFLAALALLLLVTTAALGPNVLVDYATHLHALEQFFGTGTPIYMPTIRGILVRVLGPSHARLEDSAAFIVWLLSLLVIYREGARGRRTGVAFEAADFALPLAVGLLASPHLFTQDVLLWVAPVALQLSWPRGRGRSHRLTCLILATPAWFALARMTNLAASSLPFDVRIVPLAAALVWIWREQRGSVVEAHVAVPG